MKLYIDTSSREKLILKLDNQVFETDVQTVKSGKSQTLLPYLKECLEKVGKKISDITEIETAQGSGSFTGLRVGVSVANALGWVLGVPVNGKEPSKGEISEVKYS